MSKDIENTTENVGSNATYINPFTEEFDVSDVVNRVKSSDHAVNYSNIRRKKEQSYFIPKKELENIVEDFSDLKVYKKDTQGNIVAEYEEDSYRRFNNFINNLDKLEDEEYVEIKIPVEITESKKTKPNYEYGKNRDYDEADENKIFTEFLQEGFKDYLVAEKISGNKSSKFSDKVISQENLNNGRQKIEIADVHTIIGNELKKTSIMINRNEDMEIDSIEILCKCGEKTILKFNEIEYSSEIEPGNNHLVENKSDTDIIVDPINTIPLSYSEENEE